MGLKAMFGIRSLDLSVDRPEIFHLTPHNQSQDDINCKTRLATWFSGAATLVGSFAKAEHLSSFIHFE